VGTKTGLGHKRVDYNIKKIRVPADYGRYPVAKAAYKIGYVQGQIDSTKEYRRLIKKGRV
jgi:hypothetical protein